MNSTKTKFIIAGIGEILWDVLPAGKKLGGAPANFAYHCQNLGATGYVVSSIGNDTLGKEIVDHLIEKGLSQDYITIDQYHPTSTVSITLDESGRPDYTIHEQVAWDYIPFSDRLLELAIQLDAVCCGSLAQRSEASAETILQFLEATRLDCIRIFDINIRKSYYSKTLIETMLRLVNVFKLNDEEILLIRDLLDIKGTETEILYHLTDHYQLDLIVLTKGSNGSRLFSTKEDHKHKGDRIEKLVDTVGAGDSYTAAVAMGLLLKKTLGKINCKASEVAAYVCTQNGAMPTLPDHLKY